MINVQQQRFSNGNGIHLKSTLHQGVEIKLNDTWCQSDQNINETKNFVDTPF